MKHFAPITGWALALGILCVVINWFFKRAKAQVYQTDTKTEILYGVIVFVGLLITLAAANLIVLLCRIHGLPTIIVAALGSLALHAKFREAHNAGSTEIQNPD